MTPEVAASPDPNTQSVLTDAARSIQVVHTGATRACLVEMMLEESSNDHELHRFCLSKGPASTPELLNTACGRMATHHIVTARHTRPLARIRTRLVMQTHCPAPAQFICEGIEGTDLDLFAYTQPESALHQARMGCDAMGGDWRPT